MQTVIYLSAQGMILHQLDGRSVQLAGHFPMNPQGLEQLRDALLAARLPQVHILADLIEEEFRLERLPHTFGMDRRRLLARQESKLFRGTPFRHSRVQGRDSRGRRDDIVSFSALTNRDNLDPLLDVLEETGTPLSGIGSLPTLTPRLLPVLSATRGDVLVITEQPDDGLRQTFMRDGQVQFSRLAAISESSPQQYCTVLDTEIHKTRRYLDTLKLLPRDARLDVYAITDAARVEGMQEFCRNETLIRLHPVRLTGIAARLGYEACPDERYSNRLFCYLSGKSRHTNQYAPPARLKNYNTLQARRAMHAASWLLAVAGLTWSGINVIDGQLMDREAAAIGQTVTQVENRYRRIDEQLPVAVEDAHAMREALQLAGALDRQRTDLERLFTRIGSAFARHPGLLMTQFTWSAADNADGSVPTAAPGGAISLLRHGPVRASIRGRLQQFDGNYQQAHALIEQLVTDLGAQPGVLQVELARTPLDLRESSEIQGELGDGKSRTQAEFDLEIELEARREPV